MLFPKRVPADIILRYERGDSANKEWASNDDYSNYHQSYDVVYKHFPCFLLILVLLQIGRAHV